MSKRAMEDLREMLCLELEEYASEEKLSDRAIEAVHMITDTIKNIDKIEMLEDDGYSRDGEWEADMRGSYGRGSSYARGGNRGGGGRGGNRGGGYSRDDDGYSERRGQRRDSRGRYSRDDGKGKMMEHLEQMMDEADTQEQREAIRRCMDQMQNV